MTTSTGEGYAPLPASDPEAASASASKQQLAGATSSGASGEEEPRTWISLFWDTCLYVWPEDVWLQVRKLV